MENKRFVGESESTIPCIPKKVPIILLGALFGLRIKNRRHYKYVVKNTQKRVISLLIITLLAMSTVTAFASNAEGDNEINKVKSELLTNSDYDERETEISDIMPQLLQNISDDPAIGVGELKESILKKETHFEGLAIKHEVENVDIFKSALQFLYPEMNELELGKTILISLGDSEEFVATLPEEKIVEAIGYTSVIQTESFFKQTADGTKIEISEKDYYAVVSQIEAERLIDNNEQTIGVDKTSRAIALSSNAYDETETLDSYIKLTSTAYKTNPSYAAIGRNYFTIRGEVEWTKTPFFRVKDTLAIASSGNVDTNYRSFACAYWPMLEDSVYDTAYIGENEGRGNVDLGSALKIYNPSIYGVAVDVFVDLRGNYGPALKYVYAYYGISTPNDVTCQVGYAHSTVGFGDPSVSIDGSGSISFSVGLISTMDDYYGRAFTLYHESYLVSLNEPDENAVISSTSSAPTFRWTREDGLTEKYILEIDYLKNGTYMTKTISNKTSLTLSEAEWQKMKLVKYCGHLKQ